MSVQGVASAGQGSPTWPLWLLSLGGLVWPGGGRGCCPLLHLILVGQPGVPERLGPLSTSPWWPSPCSHRFQSGGWAAHVRHPGFHLCPEFCSWLQSLSSQLSQVIKEQGRVPRLGGRTRETCCVPMGLGSPFWVMRSLSKLR